jgi:hypothetical protein
VVLSNLDAVTAITLSPPAGITPEKAVTIKGKGANLAITRNGDTDSSINRNSDDSVLKIQDGAKIQFENIKVNGIKSDLVYHRAVLVKSEGTEVTLGDKVVITGELRASHRYAIQRFRCRRWHQ